MQTSSSLMRNKGRITEWQDDRGFGFVTPIAGGERVFVHIKSFTRRHRRPIGGELVTYELKRDGKGRPQGANVTFSGDGAVRDSAPGPGATSLFFAGTFLVLMSVAVIAGKLPIFILWLYLVGSGVAFFAYAWDKSSAKNNRWRTPESTLHLFGLLGGWPGALIAQKTLRHKSSKQSFQVRFWGTVALNCGGLLWLLMNPDALR
ncbi:MAG TPA: cold shock and DUF1294 domain-containing protein [Gammaproteobacteria bacterium]|jgi:uncharacterized membrane protein YsdA (DUF1294 family)/cold shock CspA family protein|nr:cold shock and DUF1294 domain-containing protein [Gammaproteobacteria bacterium]